MSSKIDFTSYANLDELAAYEGDEAAIERAFNDYGVWLMEQGFESEGKTLNSDERLRLQADFLQSYKGR